MQNCPYITIRKKWKLFEFVSGFFWKKINKNRKNTPNRALQIVNLIILFIYQKFSNMHQTMQNCLPINVQRVNRWKIEVVNVFFIDLGPPAQFVRHCRMTVKLRATGRLKKLPHSWHPCTSLHSLSSATFPSVSLIACPKFNDAALYSI